MWPKPVDRDVNRLCCCSGMVFCQIRACGGDSVAEEGRQSWRNMLRSRNVAEEEEEEKEGRVPAKRLRCGSPGGVEVVLPTPLPSLLPVEGSTLASALSAVRMADMPTGGMNARCAVPPTALSTSWCPKPSTENAPSFSLVCQSVVQTPRRPCSFVFHHSVVGAAAFT